MINEVFHNHYDIHAVGMDRTCKRDQLASFRIDLRNQGGRIVRTILIAASGLKFGKYAGNIMSVVSGNDLFAEVV